MALWKLQCFFTKVMSPYRFFDGSGPKFFCRVNGLSDKLIMERTGHRDIRSLHRYQRPDVSTKMEISKALNCRSEGSVGEREAESSLKREVDQLVDGEVKGFCQDDNNATVKGSNSVVFQNCSFVISKDLKFS